LGDKQRTGSEFTRQQKFLEAAKQAMGREVFEQELAEHRPLLEEFQERVGIATVEKLKSKIFITRKTSRLIFEFA